MNILTKERDLFFFDKQNNLAYVFAKIKQILHHCAFLARMLVVEKKRRRAAFLFKYIEESCNAM